MSRLLLKRQVQAINQSKNPSLLDQSFTDQTLNIKINNTNASILHIATHGRFNSDPNQTFIVAWNDVIKAKNFDEILQRNNQEQTNNLQLLVLSACQTAQGDRRATLGLAGIAVQAGVNTTLASLWTVNDKATAEFMAKFYENLTTETNIAIALQQTQLYFLNKSNILVEEYSSPYYWSPFIIVGNWLK
jgi:CHAT domain-containing protein